MGAALSVQSFAFIPLVMIMPKIGNMGVIGVFIAPALTDLIVLILSIFMLISEFRNMTRLEKEAM